MEVLELGKGMERMAKATAHTTALKALAKTGGGEEERRGKGKVGG